MRFSLLEVDLGFTEVTGICWLNVDGQVVTLVDGFARAEFGEVQVLHNVHEIEPLKGREIRPFRPDCLRPAAQHKRFKGRR